MAEGGNKPDKEKDSWEGWFGGWVQTAKEKSQSALEFVKKDLAEFGTCIQKETEKAVEITKGSLHSESTTEATKKVKAGLVSFLDNVSKVLVIPHDDDDDSIPMKVSADGSGLYDRGKARLHALQLDASTYVDPPHGSPEQFSMWLESFNLDEHKGEISELLVSKVEVRALYTKLVPSEVSNAVFWQRYFYRVHQLQCDEARKQALMMRADLAGSANARDSFSWDDDEEDDDDGNHSDWEKMPRPPQSYAAQKEENKTPPTPPTNDNPTDDTTTLSDVPQTPRVSEVQPVKPSTLSQTQEKEQEATVTEMPSSLATEPSLKIAMSELPSPDGTEASSEWSPLADAASAPNPWSLHISQDVESASEGGEEQATVETSDNAESVDTKAVDECLESEEKEVTADGAQSQNSAAVVEDIKDSVPVIEKLSLSVEKNEASVEKPAEVSAEPENPENSPSLTTTQQTPASEEPLQTETNPCPTTQTPTEQPASENVPSESPTEEKNTSEPLPVTVDGAESPFETQDDSTVVSEEEVKFVPVKDTESAEVWSKSGEAKPEAEAVAKTNDSDDIGMKMKVKGDIVVVGDRDSPSSTESADLSKELGLDDDWEQDFDVEITEEDLKAAEDIAKRLGENMGDDDDDWENWE